MILTRNKIDKIDIEELINSKISGRKLDELLLIVPTNRKVRKLKQEIIARSPFQAVGELHVETIGTLSSKLFFHLNPRGKIISESVSTVLMKQCFQEVVLNYFLPYKKEIPAGTIQRVKNVIGEYKKHGITPSLLKKEAEKLVGTEKIKALDIASLYEQNLNKYNELFAYDTGDVYRFLNDLEHKLFYNCFFDCFARVETIIINGFDEFTTPEINIIESLSTAVQNSLYIRFDYYENNPLLFFHLDNCYRKFIAKGFLKINDKTNIETGNFQTLIRKELFNSKKKEKIRSDIPITVINASTREQEAELIAKEIKTLLANNSTEPHKICVVFNRIDKYSAIVRDVFTTYGIPFNLTDRFPLNESYKVISIINFLEILENDFYYKNIFRALSSGLLESHNINLSYLMRVSRELKIVSGFENWKEQLNNALQEKENDIDEEKEIAKHKVYKTALNDIEKLYELLIPFDKNLTLKEFLNELLKLIHGSGLSSKLVEEVDGYEEINIKAVTTFIDTIRELFTLFEREYGSNNKFSIGFFINHIRTMVDAVRYHIKEKPNYGVQITNLNEIRGLEFDILFIGGLCDGDLPTRYTPEIFFSGSYVKNELTHQTEERYHFYQSLCAFKHKLYLSFPYQDNKKELTPSGFLTEFTNLFETINKSVSDFDQTVFSFSDLLKYIGRNNNNEFNTINKLLEDHKLPFEMLKDSFDIDKMRMNEPFGENAFAGNILQTISNEAQSFLKQLSEKQFSISQLETYAKCPYKYFAERILKLDPSLSGLEEPTEEIEALEMGSVLHDILYDFYTLLNRDNAVLYKCNDNLFEIAKRKLFTIAERKIEEANFKSPMTFYEREKILGINGIKENSILFKFLEYERNNNENYTPSFFEISFGKLQPDTNDLSTEQLEELSIGNVKVRGKIDRIDVDTDNKLFRVVDYKLSGKKPSYDDIVKGISLQITLYIFAASELLKFKLKEDFNPSGADIYSLKFSNKEFGKNKVNLTGKRNSKSSENDTALIEETLIHSLAFIEKYVANISAGKFNLSTLQDRDKKVCNYCNFMSICRIKEIT